MPLKFVPGQIVFLIERVGYQSCHPVIRMLKITKCTEKQCRAIHFHETAWQKEDHLFHERQMNEMHISLDAALLVALSENKDRIFSLAETLEMVKNNTEALKKTAENFAKVLKDAT